MQETFKPFLGLEANQIIFEHRAHQPLVKGQRDEQARGRPRDMQEEADAVFQSPRPQALAQGQQMIIMHPDQIVFLDQGLDAFGKAFVYPFIAFARLTLVFGQIEPIMEQRPQCRIGIAIVIFVNIAG